MVDASVIVHILLDAQIQPELVNTLERSGDLMAPHLIDLEVLSAIRKQLNLKKISDEKAKIALEYFSAITIDRRPVQMLIPRI